MACIRCGADAELVCEVASDVSTIRVCAPCGYVAHNLVGSIRAAEGAMSVRWLDDFGAVGYVEAGAGLSGVRVA